MRTRPLTFVVLALTAGGAHGMERGVEATTELADARSVPLNAPFDLTLRLRPALRAQGEGVAVPRIGPSQVEHTPEEDEAGPSWGAVMARLDAERDAIPVTVPLGEGTGDADTTVRLNAGRTTVLSDGGIGGSGAFVDEQTQRERIKSYAQGDAEFDHYDLSLEWAALRNGPVTFLFSGGVRAINATAGRRYDQTVAPGVTATTYEEGRAMVPVPVVGTGVRLHLADGFFLSGGAATHTIPDGATLLDFTAQTGLELNPNVGIYAGYQMIQSSVEVNSINAELDQEGVFARLRIRF